MQIRIDRYIVIVSKSFNQLTTIGVDPSILSVCTRSSLKMSSMQSNISKKVSCHIDANVFAPTLYILRDAILCEEMMSLSPISMPSLTSCNMILHLQESSALLMSAANALGY